MSKPTNVQVIGERQVQFSLNVGSRDVVVHATCEAILNLPPDQIGPKDVARAIELVKADQNHRLSRAVISAMAAQPHAGDSGLPIWINTLNIDV